MILSDVLRLSDVCLSRTSGLSREQRSLGRQKLAEVAHVTRELGHPFKVKGRGHKGRGILWRPPAPLVKIWHVIYSGNVLQMLVIFPVVKEFLKLVKV